MCSKPLNESDCVNFDFDDFERIIGLFKQKPKIQTFYLLKFQSDEKLF